MLFVVGPSGVGTTTFLAKARSALSIEILDLDAEDNKSGAVEWGEGWESRRWARDVRRLARAEEQAKSSDVVVDVGAGSLQTPDGRSYFQTHGNRSIAVLAPWEIVLPRSHPGRDPAEFKATEYSPERLAVYSCAKLSVDAGSKSEDEAALDFIRCIQALL